MKMWILGITLLAFCGVASGQQKLNSLCQEFTERTGAKLVFERADLPPGRYHDILKPLKVTKRLAAARVCIKEAHKYPPKYFGNMGLSTIGVFAACASKQTTDSGRDYDREIGGYRYYGVYNGQNGIAAAMYSESQLRLTFHHEVFHHVDSTVDGVTEKWQLGADDAFYSAAVSGIRPYPAPPISWDDLAQLKKRSDGKILSKSVSNYAAKNSREDQAETARYFMTHLPSSLVQMVEKPHLAGSQRLIHLLGEYSDSCDQGPGVDWFVDVALGRTPSTPDGWQWQTWGTQIRQLRQNLETDSQSSRAETARQVRFLLSEPLETEFAFFRAAIKPMPDQERTRALVSITELTMSLMESRIKSKNGDRYRIWGYEDANGANQTLRNDVYLFGKDAKRLARLFDRLSHPSASSSHDKLRAQTVMQLLHTLVSYHEFIDNHYDITKTTEQIFVDTKSEMVAALPQSHSDLASKLQACDWPQAKRLTASRAHAR